MSDLADDIQDKVGLDIEYGVSPITTLAFSERMEAEHRGDILSYGPDPIYQKPVIGPLSGWHNGYVATRFGGMGMVLSVGTGLIMADLIANNQVPYYARHLLDYLSPA